MKQLENTSAPKHPRMVSRGDGFKVIPIGRRKAAFADLYVKLLGGSWKNITVAMVGFYLVINLGRIFN